FFVGIALSALQIIPMSLIPDVIDIDEYENNIRREGAFNGIIMFMHKAATGIAVGGVGLLIEFFGYTEAAPNQSAADIAQPESALTAIRIILALIPAIAFIIAIIFTWKLDVSKQRFDTIVKEIGKRNNERKRIEINRKVSYSYRYIKRMIVKNPEIVLLQKAPFDLDRLLQADLLHL